MTRAGWQSPGERASAGPTRRQFLGALGGATLLGLAATAEGRLAFALPSGSASFVEPRVLRSSGGHLAVTLVAAPSTVTHGSGKRFAYTYNGTTPGPTLRVRPGDALSITLKNHLGEATNLHTHGLHVSPSGGADNIFVSIPAGEQYTYRYRIPPDHRSGMFWYHPHEHGMVAPQVFGGLAGAIIVEDAFDLLPTLAGSVERVLILSDPRIGATSRVVNASMMDRMRGREGDVVVVNGVFAPTISARPGTLERWRILNASPSRYYQLELERHEFTMIGTDGGRLATPYTIGDVLLAPGERVEVLVTPSAAGTSRLLAVPYDRGAAQMGTGGTTGNSQRTVIATMTVATSAPSATLPSALAAQANLALPDATNHRQLVLTMGRGRGGGMGGGMGGQGDRFTIDGRSFDPARTDITTRLGRVEDWTIRNNSVMDHPFHLHVWPFQVIDRSDADPYARAGKTPSMCPLVPRSASASRSPISADGPCTTATSSTTKTSA